MLRRAQEERELFAVAMVNLAVFILAQLQAAA